MNILSRRGKEILNLCSKKSTPKDNIQAKILKDSTEFVIDDLTNLRIKNSRCLTYF